MTNAIKEFLGAQHPYDSLDADLLDQVANTAKLQNYHGNEQIYTLGEKLEGIYIVERGKVKITDALGDVISVLGRGNTFGERGLIGEGDAVTNAQASEESTLILIPAALFHELREKDAAFARFFDRQRRIKRRADTGNDLSTQSIGEVMSAPVMSVAPDCDVQEAAMIMAEKRVSCLAVCEGEKLVGIFTLRDLVYKVLAGGEMRTVRKIMAKDPVTIRPDDMIIDAMMVMSRRNIGHLPVVENGQLRGIVTKSNLVARGANSIMGVLLGINRAKNIGEMTPHVRKLPMLLAQMAGAGVEAHIITKLLTDIADAATRRLIALFVDEHGEAPAPFVWAACGSQGRQEQTGVSDQDNVIIYADDAPNVEWYQSLAEYVTGGLDALGYFYCPGDMMASNPKWRQPVSVWRGYFMDWIRKPTKEAQMLTSVMFDLRAIEGDAQLLENLREDVLEAAYQNKIFQAFLISNALGHQPPLSLFRGLSTFRSGEHKNTIDLKHNGVVPITDLARVFAIKGRVAAVGTRARLEAAIAEGALSESGGQDLIAALDYIAETRLAHQMAQIRAGEKPDNFLSPSSLSDLERSHLRDAFVVVKSMQSALSRYSAP